MNYDDGAETIVLYTKGTKGTISEELRQFLNYMENTDQNNAVNEDLKDIQEMVDVVKRDGEVSLQYMKSFEHDQLMYAACEKALQQIEDRDYAAKLKDDGMRNIIKYGIACYKNNCKVMLG